MVEIHHQMYIKTLSKCINTFWYGSTEEAYISLINAELNLNLQLNKPNCERFLMNLQSCLKKWREIILNYNHLPPENIFNTSHNQYYEISNREESFPNSSISSLANSVVIDSKNQIENFLDEVFDAYYNGKIVESVNLLNKIVKKKKNSKNEVFDNSVIKEIISDYTDIYEVFKEIEEKNGYLTESLRNNLKVSYKAVEENNNFSILTEFEVNIKLINMITILNEVDLHPNWIPFCKGAEIISTMSRFRKIIHQEYEIPLLSSINTCTYTFGANLLSTQGCVAVIAKSCNEKKQFRSIKLPEIDKNKKIVINLMGILIRPLSSERISVQIYSNFEVGSKKFPYNFFPYFSQKLSKGLLRKISKISKNFEDSEYNIRKNMQKNKKEYEFLENSVQEYFRSMKN